MKVISKPKLPIQKCKYCGSELKISYRDLQINRLTLRKDMYSCKVCKGRNTVEFDKGE